MASNAPPGGVTAAQQHAASGTTTGKLELSGGRFDFDDGGTYCGGWEDGKAHGHGVCTGPKGQGEYSGSWHYGFEVSGVYTWPSGSTYEGHWQNGKRHGLGVEARGRWLYRGEWTQGFKGRYGVRQSTVSSAKYEGTWANGLQDGYGSETYADGGTYQGQWLRGMRHGYGARTSAPFGLASHFKNAGAGASSENVRGSETSLNAAEDGVAPPMRRNLEETRGGFVLRTKSDEVPHRRRSLVERSGMKNFVQGLKLKKQRSTGDLDRKGVSSIRSTGSTTSWMSSESGYTAGGASVMSEGSNQSFIMEEEHLDASVTETYMGEWKNDKRSGFGISERSDGLKYEGEWFNNRKYGYGVTTFRDGTKEEGKYKNNILITSNQKRHLFLIRSAKFRERIDSAINASQRASKIALQKADIAISRTATARGKAEQADIAAIHAKEDGSAAIVSAKQYSVEVSPQEQQQQLMQKQQQQQFLAAPNQNSLVAKDKSKSPFFPNSSSSNPNNSSTMTQAANNTSDPKPVPSKNMSQQQQQPELQATALPTVEVTSAPPAGSFRSALQQQGQQQQTQQQQQASPARMGRSPARQFSKASESSMGGGGGGGGFGAKLSTASNTDGVASAFSPPSPAHKMSSVSAAGVNPAPKTSFALSSSGGGAAGGNSSGPRDPETQARFDRLMSRPSASAGQAAGGPSSTFNSAPTCDNLELQTRNNLSPRTSKQMSTAASPFGNAMQQQQYKKSPEPFSSMYSSQQQQQQPTSGPSSRGGMQGGYNSSEMSRTSGMVDHFDHYRRPPSREPSVDRMPNALMEATRGSRPASRTRTPLFNSSGRGSGMAGAIGGGGGGMASTGLSMDDSRAPLLTNGGGGGGQNDLRYRGPGGGTAEPAEQSFSSIGTIPKRTESLYLKPGETSKDGSGLSSSSGGGGSGSQLQRKKSLPDVQNLVGVTASQGSKEMTREEISVLSSSRRDQMRKQMEEVERYKSNPIMYILNPRVQEWLSRQQLMLLVLFVNLSLAFMFFKLLT